MSELAFNLNGEPFELPVTATGWRVRKFKSKGAPEVVYSREGTPLVLPIDADMADLRREARHDGRYRLDAIDDSNKPVPGAPPAYVCIQPADTMEVQPAPAQPRNLPPLGPDHAVIEAMRVNSDLARAVIDKFPQMLESAAVLLRAADAAGMPARPPRPFELVDGGDEPDEASTEAPPAKAGGVMGFVEMLLEKLAPQIVNAVLSGKLQVPGGVGALLDCRRAVPHTSAAETPATSSPGVGPAPGRRDPAPAASVRIPATGTTPPSSPSSNAQPATAVPTGLPTIDAADMAHFATILNALTLQERMYAQALAGELSPAELRAWITDLKQLSVADAVSKLRAVFGTDAGAPPAASTAGIPETTSGGAS